MQLFNETSLMCSQVVTRQYSTSFSLGIRSLDKRFRAPIYAIYGFVRYADEIVDTFHEFDKIELLSSFRTETYKCIDQRISMNPVIHSFQLVVNQFKIDKELIEAFLKSMEMDLYLNKYDERSYEKYIYGSAEVVGLMCLKVFCEGDEEKYEMLKSAARNLGSAFQKVNFLRDVKSDYKERKRVYFPNVDFEDFNKESKRIIEESIKRDFDAAYIGIMKLPKGVRLGVYLAYIYYSALFKKIQQIPSSKILGGRVRVSDNHKLALLVQTYLRHKFNVL